MILGADKKKKKISLPTYAHSIFFFLLLLNIKKYLGFLNYIEIAICYI